MATREIVLCEAVRTPIGAYDGSLKTIPASDLGTVAIKAVLDRSKLDPAKVGTVVMGNVIQAGNKMNPTRQQFRWPSLQASSVGLEIAATGRIVELYRFDGPAEWTAAPLFRLCCNSLLGSFKIWNAATVGGNICMSLPAGPMLSLTTALEATCTLWPRDAAPRDIKAIDFVTGRACRNGDCKGRRFPEKLSNNHGT